MLTHQNRMPLFPKIIKFINITGLFLIGSSFQIFRVAANTSALQENSTKIDTFTSTFNIHESISHFISQQDNWSEYLVDDYITRNEAIPTNDPSDPILIHNKPDVKIKAEENLVKSFDSEFIKNELLNRKYHIASFFQSSPHSEVRDAGTQNVNNLFNQVFKLINNEPPYQGYWFAAALRVDCPALVFLHQYRQSLNISVDASLLFEAAPADQDALNMLCTFGVLGNDRKNSQRRGAKGRLHDMASLIEYLLEDKAYNNKIFLSDRNQCVNYAAKNFEKQILRLIVKNGYLGFQLAADLLFFVFSPGNYHYETKNPGFIQKLLNKTIKTMEEIQLPLTLQALGTAYAKLLYVRNDKVGAQHLLEMAKKSLSNINNLHDQEYIKHLKDYHLLFLKGQPKEFQEAIQNFNNILHDELKSKGNLRQIAVAAGAIATIAAAGIILRKNKDRLPQSLSIFFAPQANQAIPNGNQSRTQYVPRNEEKKLNR